MFIEASYVIYLAISITITVWVARILYRRGLIFLVDAFSGNRELAESINHLLVVGFYLINAGYVTYTLRSNAEITNLRQSIELLADKLGMVLLVLGVMHLFNVFLFSSFRRRAMERNEYPVLPNDVTAVRAE